MVGASIVLMMVVFSVFLYFSSPHYERQTISASLTVNPNLSNLSEYEDTQNNFLPYVSDAFGITVQYPADWKVFETGVYPIPSDSVDTIVSFEYFASEDASRPIVNVYVEKLNPVPSLADYLEESIVAEKDFTGATILESNSSATLSGRPAYIIVSTYAAYEQEKDPNFKKIEIGTIVGNLGYGITYDVEENDYAKYLPYVQKMIDSFQVSPSLRS